MTRKAQKGFSLVELMVAILLASITAVVVLHVLTSYQRRTATLLGSNEAQINAAIGLYAIEKEVRMAGAGLTTSVAGPPTNPGGRLCGVLGVNMADDSGDVISSGAPLMPLRIIDGGAGPDTIEILRSDAPTGAAPVRLVQTMASADANISVDGRLGLVDGDLIMIGAPDGSKRCTMTRLGANPTAVGSLWTLQHELADYGANEVAYDVRDAIVNMGRYGLRRFTVLCNDGEIPSATNTCDLGWYDVLSQSIVDPADAELADLQSIAPQIVELQAQYGIAEGNRDTVTSWVNATAADGWEDPDEASSKQIKAVRIALVARAARDGNEVAPDTLVLWDDGDGNEMTLALDADQRRFRYQVLTVVVPLMNVIWADSIS